MKTILTCLSMLGAGCAILHAGAGIVRTENPLSVIDLERAAQIERDKGVVIVEAESFKDRGGWVNDTQFMDQTGSPYLLAHGLGRKTADAHGAVSVSKAGVYSVYARTKNWAVPWYKGADGPGRFKIAVNGRELENVLGGDGAGEWLWSKAGTAILEVGENTISLKDMDGFDGRCDAVAFVRGGDAAQSALDSARFPKFISEFEKEYDFVVVGGGIAGICAAVSAARLGLRTALVQDRPVLGGNNSSEVRVHIGAYKNIPPYPRLGDIVSELVDHKAGGNAERAEVYDDARKLDVVKTEKNLDLFLNEHVSDVVKNDSGAIECVISRNTVSGARTAFDAPLFADCTGDGTVGFLAGAEFRHGRESQTETGEKNAPPERDMKTMGASVQWRANAAKGDDASFPLRPWMYRFTNANGSPSLKGDWWWEAGIGRDQILEGEYIRDYGLFVAYSNWAFVKNVSARKAEFADKALEWVAFTAGRRESRRLVGDVVLTGTDMVGRKKFSDGTCSATWTIDLHLPKTAAETRFPGEPYMANSFQTAIWPCQIPYRCLYSKNVPNLFMAGRCISVTHVALGSTRLMRTHGMMGEVVGMAAGVCKKHSSLPRSVYSDYFNELKALMRKGAGNGKKYAPHKRNLGGTLDKSLRKTLK